MKHIGMDQVFTMEVIICTMERRGKGVEGDPVRVITQVFTKKGDFIAEHDPWEKEQQFAGIRPGYLDKPITFPEKVKDVIKEVKNMRNEKL